MAYPRSHRKPAAQYWSQASHVPDYLRNHWTFLPLYSSRNWITLSSIKVLLLRFGLRHTSWAPGVVVRGFWSLRLPGVWPLLLTVNSVPLRTWSLCGILTDANGRSEPRELRGLGLNILKGILVSSGSKVRKNVHKWKLQVLFSKFQNVLQNYGLLKLRLYS